MRAQAHSIYDFPKAQLADIKRRVGEPGLHVLDYFWVHRATLQKTAFPTKEAFLTMRLCDAAMDEDELNLLVTAAKRGERLAYEAASKLAEKFNKVGDRLPPLLQDFIVNLLLVGKAPPSRRKNRAVERDSIILAGMSILVNCYGRGRPGRRGCANRLSIEASAGLVSSVLAELEALGVNGVVCGDDKIQKMWRANRARALTD
jgi:hypothetical protein